MITIKITENLLESAKRVASLHNEVCDLIGHPKAAVQDDPTSIIIDTITIAEMALREQLAEIKQRNASLAK